jgi:hypothetical protein
MRITAIYSCAFTLFEPFMVFTLFESFAICLALNNLVYKLRNFILSQSFYFTYLIGLRKFGFE